jgi:hypothetical protein
LDLRFQSKNSMKIINNTRKFKIYKLISNTTLFYRYTLQKLKFFEKKTYTEEFIFITAADSEYYEPCLSLVKNIRLLDPTNKIVVYNLGLTSKQTSILTKIDNLNLIEFQFENYPSFIKEKKLPDNRLGNYAWKAVIISEVLKNYTGNIIWLDSACILDDKIDLIKRIIVSKGLFFVKATGNIEEWTHLQTLKIMDAVKLANKDCVMSGIIGINSQNAAAKALIFDWVRYSLNEECIAPKGSSRLNHRQDQSIFQILVYKHKLSKNIYNHKNFNIKINQVFTRIYLQELNKVSYFYSLRKKLFASYPTLFTNSLDRASIWVLFNENLLPKQYLKLMSKKNLIFIKKIDNRKHSNSKNLENDIEISILSGTSILKSIQTSSTNFGTNNLLEIQNNYFIKKK